MSSRLLLTVFIISLQFYQVHSMQLDQKLFEELKNGLKQATEATLPPLFESESYDIYVALCNDLQRADNFNELYNRSDYSEVKKLCELLFSEISQKKEYKKRYEAAIDLHLELEDEEVAWANFTNKAMELIGKKFSEISAVTFESCNSIQDFFILNQKFDDLFKASIHIKSALFLLYRLKQIRRDALTIGY